jgi:hypothetical protein
MAKKRPSLKRAAARGPAIPDELQQMTPELLNRLLDSAIMGGVDTGGRPANQRAILPPASGAGMTQVPIPQDQGGGGLAGLLSQLH